jgi:glutaredoxin-like protein
MSLISESDQQMIRNNFNENFKGDVEIVMFTERESAANVPGKQPCETCGQTEELLKEVAGLSGKLTVAVHEISSAKEEAASYGIDRVPAFVVKGATRGRMRFLGIPAGYEFPGFLADLVDASKGTTDLSDETRAFLASLAEDINIKVFTMPTCPYCPAAARLAHQMAVESAHVTADVIEATEFLDLAQHYGVSGVPKTVINDKVEFMGALPESQFLSFLKTAIGANGEAPNNNPGQQAKSE